MKELGKENENISKNITDTINKITSLINNAKNIVGTIKNFLDHQFLSYFSSIKIPSNVYTSYFSIPFAIGP